MDNITVVDDILLALQPPSTCILRPPLTMVGDVVGVGDHLGADEPLLEVGVDLARALGRGLRRPETGESQAAGDVGDRKLLSVERELVENHRARAVADDPQLRRVLDETGCLPYLS